MTKKDLNGDFPIAVHPGEILQDWLKDCGASQLKLARHLGVDPAKINEICRGKRGVSAEMATALGRVFGVSAQMWLNMQKQWELSQVDSSKYAHLKQLERIAA